MKVAIFSWESLESIAVGGVAVHVSELARVLAASGRQVHLFTRRGPGQLPYTFIDGVHHHRCHYHGSLDFVEETDRMGAAFLQRFDAVGHRVAGIYRDGEPSAHELPPAPVAPRRRRSVPRRHAESVLQCVS